MPSEIAYEEAGAASGQGALRHHADPLATTPELALGFLYCESVIDRASDVPGRRTSRRERERREDPDLARPAGGAAAEPGRRAGTPRDHHERRLRPLRAHVARGTEAQGLRQTPPPGLQFPAGRFCRSPENSGRSSAYIRRRAAATAPDSSTKRARRSSSVRTSAATMPWTRSSVRRSWPESPPPGRLSS